MRVNCSTCLELLTPSDNLVCTPCGHVFHVHCVMQWFESKKNCPQCRHSANEKNIRKIYLSEIDGDDTINPDDLQNKLDNVQFLLRSSNSEREDLRTKLKDVQENNAKIKEEIKKIEHARRKAEESMLQCKNHIRFLKEEREKFEQYQKDAEIYKEKLKLYVDMEKVMRGSISEVNLLLGERGSFDKESRDLATLVVELKKKLIDMKRMKALAVRKAEDTMNMREEDRRKISSLTVQLNDLKALKDSLNTSLQTAYDQITNLTEEKEELQSKVYSQEKTIKDLKKNSIMTLVDSSEDESPKSPKSSAVETPEVAFKSCGIAIGEKRKPLSQSNHLDLKRPKLRINLMEVGTQKGQMYDGMGGNTKPDVFPEPLPRHLKKSVKKRTNTLSKVEKQKQTIDRFFGSFDSP